MAQKITVQQHRGLKTARVEDGATVGAQVGVNLYDADGNLITDLSPSGIRNIFQTFVNSVGSGSSDTTGMATEAQLLAVLATLGETGLTSTDDAMTLSILNSTTLHIGPITLAYFESLGTGFPLIQLPAQDVPLSAVSLPADGSYVRFVGVDSAGAVQFSADPIAGSKNILQLGAVFITRLAGVNSFMDPYLGNNGVFSKPMLANIDNYSLQMIKPLQQDIPISPLPGSLSFTNTIGQVSGLSINWHEQISVGLSPHEINIPQRATTPFTPIYAGIAQGGVVPPQVTLVDPTQYWNGAALVPLSSNVRASVQRLCVTWRGIFFVQYGEAEYASFADAVSAISIAPFTGVFPEGGMVEILRMALQKTCADLSDPNTAEILYAGGGGGGGGGTGGTSPTGTGFVHVTSGAQDANAVPETGTGSVVLAISPAMTGNPTAPTQATSDNSTRLANTAYVKAVVASLPSGGTVNSVTGTLPITVGGTPTVNPVIGINAATDSLPGSMSAADKAKLDGINLSLYAPINAPVFTGTKTTINSAAAADTILEFQSNGVVDGQILIKANGEFTISNGSSLIPAILIGATSTSVGIVNGVVDIFARNAAQSQVRLSFHDEAGSGIRGSVGWDRPSADIFLRRTSGATLTLRATSITSDVPIFDNKGDVRLTPIVNITTQYILSEADIGKAVVKTSNTAFTVYCNVNSVDPFSIGGTVTVVNRGGTTGNIALSAANGATLYYPGGSSSGGSGSIAIAPGDSRTVLKVDTDIWNVI